LIDEELGGCSLLLLVFTNVAAMRNVVYTFHFLLFDVLAFLRAGEPASESSLLFFLSFFLSL